MSAESGKAVERFDCTNGGAQFCQGCYTMTSDSEGEYVRHEDYAKLEQQRAALVEALTSARDYITSELDRERQTFKGHENCSDIPAIERDLAQVDAALRAAGVEL